MKRLISIILFITAVFPLCLLAQQKPLFTNYVFNDYYYNPAIPSTKEVIDFRFLYRNQWAGLDGKPQTQTFSAYGALKKFPLGLGGNLYHDKTGPLRTIGFNVSASYGIKINEESILSAGIAAGIIRLELGDGITIREQGDDAVTAAQQGKTVADISLGIYYKWKGLFAGFSIPQIVESDMKFTVNDPAEMNKLVRHYFLAAGYKFPVGDKFELEPSFLLKAVKAAPLQGDINLKGIYDNMVWLGASYRTGDAIAIFAGVIIKDQFQIGYAYDITTSNLNNVSNGSHEILLNYRLHRN